jgi:hypothetical protein
MSGVREVTQAGAAHILCGAAHFGSEQFGKDGALDEVEYKAVSAASELP